MATPPADPPTTMRAWTHTVAGAPATVLTPRSNLPVPANGSSGPVLVRVHHASLNPGGSIMMQLAPTFLRTRPCIPELDFAGTVAHLGAAYPLAGTLKPGMRVFGSVPVGAHMRGSGSLAEFVAVAAEDVVPVPDGVELREAAGLAVAGCTALKLLDAARVQEGMKVLVNAAGGGIGSLVLQMVRGAAGPAGVVVAVCSGEKAELVRRLGADEVLDYRAATPVYDVLRQRFSESPFDLVIDALGVQALFESSPSFLKASGSFVSVGVLYSELSYRGMMGMLFTMAKNLLLPVALGGIPRKYLQLASAVTQPDMVRLAALCEQRQLEVPIDSEWEFDDVLKAYERMLSQRAKGKIIVNL